MEEEFHLPDILLLVAFVAVILIWILGMVGKD